tara:strand:+ start:46563 stop:47372 length:810 start_codon:yes stop_codon:yes gene_type:complete
MAHEVVLITGGSSGIGKSIGVYLKSKGFKVYGTTRNRLKYPDFNEFDLLEVDVRNSETINAAISKLIALEGRIDVLVNNAGVGITGPIEETPQDEIAKAFDTNLYGPIRMIKAVLPQMRIQKNGLVINITSIAGFMGLPYRGIYSATKGALELVTESIRMEVKNFGVSITNVAPGDFATNIASGRYHAPLLNDSPYEEPYSRTLEAINNDVNSGGDPIDVAYLILKIIQTKKPKIHYKVGSFMQKFSLFLKKVLPDKVYEKLLLNHYKL